jgi:hypothetical protein
MTRRIAPLVVAFALCASCEQASFESLGTRPAVALRPRVTGPDAGTTDMQPSPGGEPAGSSAVATDTANAGAGGLAVDSGTAGMLAAAGSGGIAVTDTDAPQDTTGLTGRFEPKPFESVQAGFVVGRSDEFGTTTLYLLDHPVTCDEISTFAWLVGLSADVQVIEIMFPSTAVTGSLVSGSVISHAEGGMFSFSKNIASMRSLVLSRNETSGVVEGLLDATFSEGHAGGTFHAEYCASGMAF